jgi:hypothetical protein
MMRGSTNPMANGRRTTTRNSPPPPPAGSVPLVVDNGEEQRLADLPPVFPGGGAAAAPITASAVEERRDVELDDILNELGGDSRIRVYHVVDGRSAFAGELGAENFTLDTVLEHFGGGEKTLKIYQGRNHVTTARILLDPSVPIRSPRQARLEAEKRLSPGAGGGLGDIASLISAMGTAQLSQVQMMQMMMAASQKQSADMMQMQQAQSAALMTAMTGMITAVAGNKTDPLLLLAKLNEGKTDPLEMALKVAEAVRPKDQPSTSVMDAMTIFEKGLNIGQKVTGGGDDSVMGVVSEGVKALGSLVEGIVTTKKAEAAAILANAQRGGAPHNGGPALPAVTTAPVVDGPAPEVVGTITPNGGGPAERLWIAFARRSDIEKNVVQMSRFLTPAAAADTIINKLPDAEFNDMMEDLYSDPNGFGQRLAQAFPVVGEIDQQWLGAVVTEIIEQTTPDDEDAAADGDGGAPPATDPAP